MNKKDNNLKDGNMDHSKMDHSKMDHSNMDHGKMDHSKMDHSKMDHSNMDHDRICRRIRWLSCLRHVDEKRRKWFRRKRARICNYIRISISKSAKIVWRCA